MDEREQDAALQALLRSGLAPPLREPDAEFVAQVSAAIAEAERYRRWRASFRRQLVTDLLTIGGIAGALLAFAFAMLEVSDSLILAQKISYYPITKAILDLTQRLGDGLYIASALGVWAMVLLVLTILFSNSMLGRKMGAVFRI